MMPRFFDEMLAPIIIVVILISLVLLFFNWQDNQDEKVSKYCQEFGWDKGHYITSTCIKKVPHESGLGYDIVTSGKVDWREE